MGHIRVGALPITKPWNEVVRLIGDGANVVSVAEATVRASERAFSFVQDDPGFKEAVWLMTQLAVAAKKSDPAQHLSSVGIELSKNTSFAEVAVVLSDALDRKIDAAGARSDFGEMAQRALVAAVSGYLDEGLHGLFSATPDDVASALGKLGKRKEFGKLAASFFGKLTRECLEYFLSKALATHLGDGQRFATMNQMAQFERALEKYCQEVSAIVEGFGGEWFSKHLFEEKGSISRKSSEGFGWFALEKMRKELVAAGKQDAD